MSSATRLILEFTNLFLHLSNHNLSSDSPKIWDWLIVGCADDPRVTAFRVALQQAGYSAPRHISYAQACIGTSAIFTPNTVLRFTAPWNFTNIRQWTLDGETAAQQAGLPTVPRANVVSAQLAQGEWLAPHQLHYGFSQQLHQITQQLRNYPIAATMQNPDDLLTCYDKAQCHHQLALAGIAVPAILPAGISNYDELRDQMRRHNLSRVFIKSRFGAGGMGIMALAIQSHTHNTRLAAYTTLVRHNQSWFNANTVQKLTAETAISTQINALCASGIHVEQWVPKTQINGKSSDIRVLMIAGHPAVTLVRSSRSPITNLRLLNQRQDTDSLIQALSQPVWEQVLATCRRVAQLFPRSFYLGLDLAVNALFQRHWVLEVNGFGDFLKDITTPEGLTPYAAEIQQFPIWLRAQPSHL